MSLDIKTVSPDEAQQYLRKAKASEINFPFGMSIKGSAELTCREVATGEVAWTYAADNVVTDYGRRVWFDQGIQSMCIMLSSSVETPDLRRNSLIGPYDSAQVRTSNSLSPTWNGSTYQKTWGVYTFAAPGALATIGTVGLFGITTMDWFVGAHGISSYLLLSPAKTQTTSQQLEVVYKLTFSPNL